MNRRAYRLPFLPRPKPKRRIDWSRVAMLTGAALLTMAALGYAKWWVWL